MSTYKFCGGKCPQCPPGSAAYGRLSNLDIYLKVSTIMIDRTIVKPFLLMYTLRLNILTKLWLTQ